MELESSSVHDILTVAGATIGNRGSERDKEDGERSMKRTVQAFNAIFSKDLTETQGWRFMELLKLSRSAEGAFREDDYIDGVAYSALAAECEMQDQVRISDDESAREEFAEYVNNLRQTAESMALGSSGTRAQKQQMRDLADQIEELSQRLLD